MIDTGISMEIPEGYFGSIRDRSGMGSKGFHVFAGVIDHGFKASVKVLISRIVTGKDFQLDNEPYLVKKGDRVAQIIIQKVEDFVLVETEEFDDSERGENGIGSSGR